MKKNTLKNLLIIPLLTFCLNSIYAQDLIPLEVHNYWKYTKTVTDKGKLTTTDTVTHKVTTKYYNNQQRWYILNKVDYNHILRNTKEGQVELDTFSVDTKGNFTEIVLFKNPPKNDASTYKVLDGLYYSVSAKTTKITTPMGKFKCYKYVISGDVLDDNEKITIYIEPGVGIIRHVWQVGNKIETLDLIDYKLY